MIIMTEGKPGEGMSYKQIFSGQPRSGGGRRWLMLHDFWILKRRCRFSPAQAEKFLQAMLEEAS